MKKAIKAISLLAIAVTLDMITTWVFLKYFAVFKEGNFLVYYLHSIHPLLIFAYIPFIVIACSLLLFVCYKLRLIIEGRTVTLLVSSIFFWSAIQNIGMMVINLW